MILSLKSKVISKNIFHKIVYSITLLTPLCGISASCMDIFEMDIFEAVRHGSVDRVRRLLDDVPPDQRQVFVNQLDWDGKTPLHCAVFHDHADVAQVLIAAGANVHEQGLEGFTLLRLAAYNGYAGVAQTLIAAGIDVNQPDCYGKTPLHSAISGHHANMVQALIAAGANVHAKDKNGSTLLHFAVSDGMECHTDVAQTLIDAGVDVNQQNFKGITPLHKATIDGKQKVVLVLTTAGADVNIQDKEGKTPLHWAAKNAKKESAQFLDKCAEQIGAYHERYINPHNLAIIHHILAIKTIPTIVQMLLDQGADQSIRDIQNTRPLDIALANGNTEIAKTLSDALEAQSSMKRDLADILAMATHNRLGHDSPMQLLPQHLIAEIIRLEVLADAASLPQYESLSYKLASSLKNYYKSIISYSTGFKIKAFWQ